MKICAGKFAIVELIAVENYVHWCVLCYSEKYGDETVEVEVGKKENQEGSKINLRLYTFLKMYNDTDIYLVTDTLDSMKGMEYYHLTPRAGEI